MSVILLGISGSLRKDSGTEYAVREALSAAQEIDGDIETQFISLRNKKIRSCIHCDMCFKKNSLCVVQDDFQEVQEAFLKADGYIIGSPCYNMSITPVLSSFMSRIRPVYLPYPGHFNGKVGGALVVGGGRNSGLEMSLLTIHNFYMTYEILCSGGSLHEPAGAVIWSVDGSFQGAKNDQAGLESARRLGMRVAQMALILKTGLATLEQAGKRIYKTTSWFEY